MDRDDKRALVCIVLVCVLAFAVLWWAGKPVAAMADEACKPARAFLDTVKGKDGTVTLLPQVAFDRARGVMEALGKAKGEETKPTDSAWLVEFPDGTSGIAFAMKGCLSSVMVTPATVTLSELKVMLFSEKVLAPRIARDRAGNFWI